MHEKLTDYSEIIVSTSILRRRTSEGQANIVGEMNVLLLVSEKAIRKYDWVSFCYRCDGGEVCGEDKARNKEEREKERREEKMRETIH